MTKEPISDAVHRLRATRKLRDRARCPFHSQYVSSNNLGRSTLKRELFKLCNCLNSVKAGKGKGLN